MLGTIVALVAGAGTAWGQAPAPIAVAGGAPPAVMAGPVMQASGGNQNPLLMPPLAVGPANDPLGLGPTDSIGPPPGPTYPMPGPYTEPLWQPAPTGMDAAAGGYGGIPRFSIWGDYTLWFNRNEHVPYPLLTTGAPSQGGVLGAGSTIILGQNGQGAGSFNFGALNGFQLGADFWGDDNRRFGFYLESFFTENRTLSTRYNMTGTGPGGLNSADIPILSRPFIDSTFGNSALVFGGPGIGIASALITTSSQTWGIDPSAMFNIYRTAPGEKWFMSTDLLVGYKFLELKESLQIDTLTNINGVTPTTVVTVNPITGIPIISTVATPVTVSVAGTTVTAPGAIALQDRFTTTNLFNGVTVGFRNEFRYGMFNMETIGKLGLGDMHQIVQVQGYTSVSGGPAGTVGTAFGGLFANNSNIGRYGHDDFAVIPEARINLGVNITRGLTAFVGYNFMYMDHVVRPGDQINPVVNTASVPISPNYGSNSTTYVPGIRFNQTDYWLMGVNFGMSYRY
jgi:hypothetical protein